MVGIKPTVGLVSRDGIIPITADQDTAGPIARTVTDAAILLGVLAGYDPNDPATAACLSPGNCFSDYTRFLDKKALRGARIAVPPFPANRAVIMNAAIEVLREQGADVQTIPALAPQLGTCVSFPPPADCSTVLMYGQKRDLNKYLAATPGAPMHSLTEIIAFNSTYIPTHEVRPSDLRGGRHAGHVAGQRGHAALSRRSGRRSRAVARRAGCGVHASSMRSSPRRTALPPHPRRRATRASPYLAGSCRPMGWSRTHSRPG